MTKHETSIRVVRAISSFGFHLPRHSRAKAGHYFVIRRSSFGICIWSRDDSSFSGL